MKRRNVDGAEGNPKRELEKGSGKGEDLKGDTMREWAGNFTFNQIKEKRYFFVI